MGEQLLQLLFSGLTIGSIYSLMGLSIVSLFSITGILNLAQGEFVVIGALIAVSLCSIGLPMIVVFPLSILLVAILGGILERLTIYRARGAGNLNMLIITIGISISLRDWLFSSGVRILTLTGVYKRRSPLSGGLP